MSFAKDGSDAVKIFWRIEQWFPELNQQIKNSLQTFHSELLKYNKTMNLIGVKTIPHADAIHFADCILAARVIEPILKSDVIYDFGSGNGFPGLVFALMMPKKKFILVEFDQRKSEFVKQMATTLKLSNVEVLQTAIEKLPPGSVNAAVSRGLSSITKSLLMTRKVFALKGEFLHMKGEEWASEIADIPTQLCSYWQPSLVGEYRLPVGEIKYAIVKTEKIAN